MASVVQKGKKRGKAQYLSGAKRQKYCKQLEVGMQGILITCNMNERKCVGEAYNLLNEYGDLLYGSEKLCEKDDHDTNSEAEDDDDIEAALKKEVDQIRSSTKKNLRRFQSVESGANNVVFIKTFDVDPEKLVHHILKDLYTTKKRKSRVIYRMIPVTGTCKAFPEDLKKYAETFFQPWFKAPNKGTFQVVYKSRNNNHMNRDDVIKDLAGIVVSQNSENKVDLSNPEYTIVVEIIKSVCCLSVVKDYPLFRKYNLQEVAKGDREEKPQDPASDGKQKEQKPQDPASDGKEKEQKPQDPASDGKQKEQKPQDPASDGKEKEQVLSEDNPATAAKTDVQQA